MNQVEQNVPCHVETESMTSQAEVEELTSNVETEDVVSQAQMKRMTENGMQ